MKFFKSAFLPFTLVTLFVAVSAGNSLAYEHDKTGYFDEHHTHHDFIHHGGHRGYYDHDKSGARVFIRV